MRNTFMGILNRYIQMRLKDMNKWLKGEQKISKLLRNMRKWKLINMMIIQTDCIGCLCMKHKADFELVGELIPMGMIPIFDNCIHEQ